MALLAWNTQASGLVAGASTMCQSRSTGRGLVPALPRSAAGPCSSLRRSHLACVITRNPGAHKSYLTQVVHAGLSKTARSRDPRPGRTSGAAPPASASTLADTLACLEPTRAAGVVPPIGRSHRVRLTGPGQQERNQLVEEGQLIRRDPQKALPVRIDPVAARPVRIDPVAARRETHGPAQLFQPPGHERFGRLTYEMWRACRLVVDTGIHVFGWSREQARAYLRDHTALSEHEIETEVDRYIAWPGQALAYKIGELAILELRARAEHALGARFDIRRFHDVILAGGSLPLGVLEDEIARFIAAELAAQKAPPASPPA